jgi:outer membrane protein TolC
MGKKIGIILLMSCLLLTILPVTLMAGTIATPAPVGEEATKKLTLTLDQAADLALNKSSALKAAEYEIERTKEVRQFASNGLYYIPTSTPSGSVKRAFSSVLASDLAWQMSMKSRDAKADAIVLSVFQDYLGIITAQEKVTAVEKDLVNGEWTLRATRVGYQYGIVSSSEKKMIEDMYKGKAAALTAAQAALEDSYQKLNTQMGMPATARPELIDKPSLIPLAIGSLESEVEIRLDASPNIWQADKSIDLNKIQLDIIDANYESWWAKKVEVDKSEETAADARDKMRQAVRNIYYSIRQVEEQYINTQQLLAQAEEALRVKQVQLSIGVTTKGEVLAKEAEVANLQQALTALCNQHETLKLTFDKPWATASG